MKKEIFFAGGCFWGMEAFFKLVRGVVSTEAGYINGGTDKVSYVEVCAGSGHAESVRVVFDDSVISVGGLVKLFYSVIDPFTLNRQGNDRGIQYRTGIYSRDDVLLAEVRALVSGIESGLPFPSVVEIGSVLNYYTAEGYHQDYLEKNPGGYCHIGAVDFKRAREFVDDSLKKK